MSELWPEFQFTPILSCFDRTPTGETRSLAQLRAEGLSEADLLALDDGGRCASITGEGRARLVAGRLWLCEVKAS